jgi:hypothetical protein
MLGRNGNVAYVRYDSHGRIVPGGPIISAKRPTVGFWQPVSYAIGNSVTSNSLRAFVRLDAYGRVVPSSLLLLAQAPSTADSGTSWLEINATYVPYVPTTTTTTTTTSQISTTTTTTLFPPSTTTTTTVPISTTTTTSTADPYYYYLTNKYNCPDCSTIVESNFLIKGAIAVNIGDWVIRNPGTGFIAFQVLSVASPNPSAYFVDTGGSGSTCPCPITTTTTTVVPSTTTTTTTNIPGTTTTTTTSVLDCTLGAVVNPTFPGGPVGLTVVQRCNSLHIPPWFEIINYTGGSGQYTLLTFNGIVLLSYETATALVNGTIIPTPLPNGWDLYRNNPPAWPVGEKFWIVFADFNNHDNRIVVPLVVGECPPQGPTNTIFMKFDIL